MQLSAVCCKLCGAICSPSQLDSVLMIVITKIPAITAVCRPSTDEAPEPEELDAPNKAVPDVSGSGAKVSHA